ncbi:MAG: DUF2784 family protein [Planctomycetota bacterium]
MLVLQDWVLFWSHTALTLFNLTGWMWKRTRVLHLVTFGLTAFSWFVLGAAYGWGYCFFTDYHAHVLRQLDHPDANLTFIQLMFKRVCGVSLSQPVSNMVGVGGFAFILLATCMVWMGEWYRRRPGT